MLIQLPLLSDRQQKRREAEERRSSERRLERRSWATFILVCCIEQCYKRWLRFCLLIILATLRYTVYSQKWKEISCFSWSDPLFLWEQDLWFIRNSYEIVVHAGWLVGFRFVIRIKISLLAYFVSFLTIVLSFEFVVRGNYFTVTCKLD